MARCLDCGSLDADPDLMQCFECFCLSRGFSSEEAGPTREEYCGSYGHPPYEWPHYMTCECGLVYNLETSLGI